MNDQQPEQVRNDFASAILAAAGEWLPLSVRYAAADAAIAVVSEWQRREAGRPTASRRLQPPTGTLGGPSAHSEGPQRGTSHD